SLCRGSAATFKGGRRTRDGAGKTGRLGDILRFQDAPKKSPERLSKKFPYPRKAEETPKKPHGRLRAPACPQRGARLMIPDDPLPIPAPPTAAGRAPRGRRT